MDFAMGVLLLSALIATTFAKDYLESLAFTVFVNFRVMDVCAMASLLCAGLYRLSHRGSRTRVGAPGERTVFLSLFCLLAYGIFQTCRGIPQFGSFAIGIARYSFLDLFWVPTLIVLLDRENRFDHFLRVLLGFIPFAWGLRLLLYLSHGTYYLDDGETEDQFRRFIEASAALSLTALSSICYPQAFVGWKGKQLTFLSAGLFAVLSMAFTLYAQQRSVWVSVVVSVAFLSGFLISRTSHDTRKRVIRVFFGSLAFLLLAAMAFLVLSPGLAAQRLAFVQGIEADSSGYWRVQGWIWGMKRVLSLNPIFGLGFGEHGFPDPNAPDNFILVPDHNQFVTACRTGGLIGLCLFTGTLFVCFRFAFMAVRICSDSFSRLRMIGLLTMLVMSSTYCMFYNQPTMLWMSVGLIISAARIEAGKLHLNRISQGRIIRSDSQDI